MRKRTFVLGALIALFGALGCENAPVGPRAEGPSLVDNGPPGTNPGLTAAGRTLMGAGMNEVYSATGQVSWSGDGVGTLATSGTVTIVKPPGSNVRRAELLCASRGFSGFRIPNGTVRVEGTAVSWDASIPGPISNWNHRANVTNIVKPVMDPAAPGAIVLTIAEGGATDDIDGCALYVVHNDSSVFTNFSVHILFGAQAVSGDNFRVFFTQPFQHPGTAQMSLAIGFGFQPNGQVSLVDVNGQRLTSCAGGQDDGEDANGALVTVGGTGDGIGNPAPNCTEAPGPRADDELYDLSTLISNGTTVVDVFTTNPSDDDDIFGALFYLSPPGSVTPTEGPPPDGPPDDGGPEQPSTCKEALQNSIDNVITALSPLVGQFQSAGFTIAILENFVIPQVRSLPNDQIDQFISSPIWGQIVLGFRAIFGPNHPVVLGLEQLADQCGAV